MPVRQTAFAHHLASPTLLTTFLGLLTFGCNAAQTKDYVEIENDSGTSACSELPTLSCDPVEPSVATCTGQTGDTENGSALPTDASFPAGCQAYFRGSDCSSRGFCTCDGEDDAGAPAHWNCHDVDSGS